MADFGGFGMRSLKLGLVSTVLIVLATGCAAQPHAADEGATTQASSDWPVPYFNWDQRGSVVDLSSQAGAVVRASMESYYLLGSAENESRALASVYTGF